MPGIEKTGKLKKSYGGSGASGRTTLRREDSLNLTNAEGDAEA